ncbi:MAG: SDR family oxidoreductase [Saprospiraceae bacterium]
MTQQDLKNKHALVCGGSKGIGFASAVALAEMGAHVTLLSRSVEKLISAKDQLPLIFEGQVHDIISLDLGDAHTIQQKIKSIFKDAKFSILINNSGGPEAGPVANAEPIAFLKAFEQHLIASHVLTQALIPGMKKNHYGRIINIISTSVKIPLQGLGVSNTIRGAMANWSKTLSSELAPFGITVNNVLPGATATERLDEIIQNKSKKSLKDTETVIKDMVHEIPMGRFAKPEEIAAAVAFLASPAASYITGINIPVDGGRTGCL